MPYASSIQVVNDANGTAHAFLADDGAIWRCQWNPQAQRWDKGEIVPGADGGEKLQALVVNNLWPANSSGIQGYKPGLVLAYRVGQGAQAEVFASLAQWDSEGQLSWSAPVPLSDDQLEDQAFALTANAPTTDNAGGFTLVAQKQQAAAPLDTLLEQLKATQSAELADKLKAAASGERLDSDLSATSFQVIADPSGSGQLVLQNQTTNTDSAPLQTADTPTLSPGTPPALSGNTQISRQQLLEAAAGTTPPQALAEPISRAAEAPAEPAEPITLGATGAAAATTTGWQGGIAGQTNFGGGVNGGGALRFGALLGQNVLRWKLPPDHSAAKAAYKAEAEAEALAEEAAKFPEVEAQEFDEDADLQLRIWQEFRDAGGFTGNRPSSLLSDAKEIEKDTSSLINPPPVRLAGDLSQLDRDASLVAGELGLEAPGINLPLIGSSWTGSTVNPTTTHWSLGGTLGLFNAGAGGPTVFSSFKWLPIEKGNNNAPGIEADAKAEGERYNSGLLEGFTKVKSGNSLGFGGTLRTIYQYQGKGLPRLASLTAEESIGVDFEHTSFSVSEAGGSLKLTAVVGTGLLLQQTLAAAEGEHLPTWLGILGYTGGLLADLEKAYFAGKSFGVISSAPDELGGEAVDSGLSGPNILNTYNVSDTSRFIPEAKRFAVANAIVGGTLAAVGPASALVAATKGWLGGSNRYAFDRSYGLEFATRVTGRYLYKSVIGLQVTLANKLDRFFFGTEAGHGADTFFFNAGVALPLGGSVPLVSYLITKEWGDSTTPQSSAPSSDADPSAADQANATQSDALESDAPEGGSASTDAPQGGFLGAGSGSQYPFSYVPQSADVSLLAATSSTAAANPALLGGQATPLQLLTLLPGALNNAFNAGSGLRDGVYTDVPILGVSLDGRADSLDGRADSLARLAFTVSNGSIDPATVQITAPGSYLALPETRPGSGIYALVPDVFSTGIAAPPATGSATLANSLATLPLLKLDSSRRSAPLQRQPIQRLSSVPVPPADPDQPPTVSYPRYDATSQQVSAVDSRSNSPYTYSQVPVQLFAGSDPATATTTATAVALLHPSAPTATVTLSGGRIVQVALDAPLVFPATTTSTSYSLQLTLPQPVLDSLEPGTPPPTYSVSPASLGQANFVADEQFSAQSGAAQTGVFLAAGLSDQLPLVSAMARWPVQNRVSYINTSGSGDSATSTVVYLNGNRLNSKGDLTPQGDVSPSDLSLEEIYSDPGLVFSAASTPTAVTIATSKRSSNGVVPGTYNNDTFVAWVEASDHVIPSTHQNDGGADFQAFMEALYGNQRLNYRINLGGSKGWVAPNLADLYHPDQAIIRHLRAVQVHNPVTNGPGTLLVWTEASLAAIKGERDTLSSGELAMPIPAVIKTVWINPNAASIQPNDLFSNADGSLTGTEAITTIPWTPSTDVGLTIEEIAIASQPQVQADGSLATTPVVSWSQEVRTPYRQSVLNDQPSIFLPFNNIQSGENTLNIGSLQSATTTTIASATGLNFAIAGALPKSRATAVQNRDGTGVLSTGLGSSNRSIRQILSNVPLSSLTASADPLPAFTAAISGTTLTISAIRAGRPAVGDLLTGPGVLAGTRISALLAVDPDTGLGTYSLDHSQTLASTDLESIPQPVRLPISSFSGAINGTTLTVSGLSEGSLQVGDILGGQGVAPTTAIVAIESFDAASGTGTFRLNTSQTLPESALVGLPGIPTTAYTIEFWAQLQPGSNPQGAGLVALGQPSEAAVGAATLPTGWLLNSSFQVQRLTYSQAAGFGLIASIPASISDPDNTLYGWQWNLQATGANTTALNGNGGRNLYANALLLANLNSGIRLEGVEQFLASYNLTATDLIGIDGADAATIANVPNTQLQFSTVLDPASGRPDSSLNGIGIDTSTSVLNQGVVSVESGISDALSSMFNDLWQFQQETGEAKVNFSLAPENNSGDNSPGNNTSNTTTSTQRPPADRQESYAGYALDFALTPGSAISVNGDGNLVFDVGDGVTLTASSTDTLPSDLRDGRWHHIVAAYLPTYQAYTDNSVTITVPTNMGTASLSIDNQLVASQSLVLDAYRPINGNDQAQLLTNNVGGAIDLLAIYNKALTISAFSPDLPGNWPQPSEQDALQLLKTLGYSAATKTPDPGAISGAITRHWLARTVNPNAAALATHTSQFDAASGSWSQAGPLNPLLEIQPTSTSYNRGGSLQDALVIQVPGSSWTAENWTTQSGSGTPQRNQFHDPATEQLTGVTVQLTNLRNKAQATTLQLSADQVLLGNQTLASLQQQNGSGSREATELAYRVPTNAPAFQLLIPRDQLPASKKRQLADDYSAIYSFQFTTADSGTPVTTTVINPNPVTLNSFANSLATSQSADATSRQAIKDTVQSNSQAIATAAVIEQAPLQLKYIDSGVVLHSAASAAAANDPAAAAPADSFGQSQVFSSFTDSSGNRQGWLAIAQPFSTNASSDPAGRVWIQYTGQSKNNQTSADPQTAPNTWLNALARSNFSPDGPNLPLLGDALYPSDSGGLLIQADPTTGWGQNFGQTMLVADVDQDGIQDLIIAAPQANGGGRVVIIDGAWIKDNLTQNTGATILNLANPDQLGSHVTVLTAAEPSSDNDTLAVANFGTALAFDSNSQALWIGAPNYLRQLNSASPSLASLQPIGALYRYKPSEASGSWGSGQPTALSPTAFGSGGTTISLDPQGSATTTYWGSQLGSAIAVDGNGKIAVSAPGVQASLLYSGTEAVQQQAAGDRNPSDLYGDGALIKIQLPVQPSDGSLPSVSSVEGTDNAALLPVVNQSIDQHSELAKEESTYMQNLKELQQDAIAPATYANNQAIQTGAVGAVYLLGSSADLQTLGRNGAALSAQSVAQASGGGATFYGALPWNTLGASGFGASLSFSDLNNSNTPSVLAIGAPQSGGSGALYLVDTSKTFTAAASTQPSWMQSINLNNANQYLAHLASSLTLYGAATSDSFASGLTDLGDVNAHDNSAYGDLLIQAYNAASGAGNGYVLFGDDQLLASLSSGAPNPATGSVAAGMIGQFQRADGSSLSLSILSELGHGSIGYTGQGTFGKGDVHGDGFNDIPLGSGPNGEAYITKGHPYLAAINSLQLSKLASDTGYLLDGLATTTQGSLRSIGDFNGDGYGDFVSIQPGALADTVRIELGGNTQDILADYPYDDYTFTVAPGTQVLPAGDSNGDGYSDIALFLPQNLSSASEGNAGAGSTTGILYGRDSIDLPLGSGFGLLAPVDASSAPLASVPSQQIPGALSTKAPAMLALGNTVYAVWCDAAAGSTNLWFAQSRDGGNSWSADTNISATLPALASGSTPSLTLFNDRLYLGFRNSSGQLALSSWDPSSGTPTAWSNPTVLSDGTTTPTSPFSPALIANGDALSVVWLDAASNSLSASSTATPDVSGSWSAATTLLQRSAWTAVADGASPDTPALASDGSSVYIAMRGENNQIYWNSSSNGGQSWGNWQELPSGFTTESAPSLAIVNNNLYLTFTGENKGLYITQLQSAGSNQWSAATQLPNQTAAQNLAAVSISETSNGVEGLALYYGASDGSGNLYRTWSATPSSTTGWSVNELTGQSTSGALAVTRFNNQTYLAYPGGTPASPSTTAYITTSADPSSAASWQTIASRDTGNTQGIGLSSDANGLLLNTSDSGTGQQAIYRLTPPAGSGGSWSQSFLTSRSSISGTAPTAALLALASTGGTAQLLLASANPAAAGAVNASVFDPLAPVNSNGTLSFQPITAIAAPSATLLNGAPVLAVNDGGSISVLASSGSPGGNSFNRSSFFLAGSGGTAGSTAAGLTTTDTGLALTYSNGDGSVSLQRLNVLQPNGDLLDGLTVNADGSLETSDADLQWQGISLAASRGLSTSQTAVPLNVNGTLMLGSVSNASASSNQVRLNAVPNLSNPDSTTWLNSTVQLSDGQGGWTVQQYGSSDLIINTDGNTIAQYGGDPFNPSWQQLNRAVLNSQAAPAFARLGSVLYAVAHDKIGTIVLNSSADDGNTWSGWTSAQASSLTATNKPPTIAVFNNSLWICYIDANNNGFKLFQYTPDSNSWGQAISFGGTQTGQYLAALPVKDNNNSDPLFAVYYVGSDSQLYYTTTTDPGNSGSFTDSALIKDQSGDAQTASGPLGAVQLNDTAYLAYQSGTTSSPGTQIIITTGATVNNNNIQKWNQVEEVPQSQAASKSINLAVRNQALVLAYGDSINGQNVTRIHQGTGSGSTWNFNPFATLENPSNSPNSLTSSSIIAQASGSGIITSVSNGNNDDALNVTIAQQNTSTTQNPAWGQLTYQDSSDWAYAPSFAEYNGKLYAVSRGANGTIVLNNSADQGATWSGWTSAEASNLTKTDKPPTIAAFNGALWICYIDADNQEFKLFRYTPDSNSWGEAIDFGGSQTGQYLAALPVQDDNSDSLFAVYYVGTDSKLYYTTTTDPGNSGSFTNSALIKGADGSGETASGPLSAVSRNNTAYLAYQGGTVSEPNNQIYITTGTTKNNNNAATWDTFLPDFQDASGPQSASTSKSVNLTANDQGLVLAYSDQINSKNVLRIYQGTGSDSTWSFSPYTNLELPASTALGQYSTSIYSESPDDLVVFTADNNAGSAPTVIANPTWTLAKGQMGTSLVPVGDVNGDGYADLMVTANNALLQQPNQSAQLTTGLRLIQGAPTSAALQSTNDPTATTQTVQLASSFGPNTQVPTASRSGVSAGTPTLALTTTETDNGQPLALSSSPWLSVKGGSSPSTPALASDGSSVYIAMRGENNQIYWNSSSNGGQSWGNWQALPSELTTESAPSLAIVNNSLYLTFTGENEGLYITRLQDAGTNLWSAATQLPNQTAARNLAAVSISETSNGVEGLALYYGASDGSGHLYRTWSATPSSATGWSVNELTGQSTSGALAVTRFNNQTYLAYPGGTPASPSTTAYITTSADPSSAASWQTIATRDTGNTQGISLSSDANGLLLNTSDSGTGQQAIYRLTPPATSGGSWNQSFSTSQPSLSSTAATASLLSLPGKLLLASANPQRSDAVFVSRLGTNQISAAFTASAADPGSAQQLFSTMAAPVAGNPGLGLGFGDRSLNTSGSYGDLNADGYLDALAQMPTTVYGADGLGWSVWGLRAAGDVNGNGTDDILLSLVAPEAVLNGEPQWIQPVLLDGALFKVNTSTNSFRLDAMREQLNPYGRLLLDDLESTSATQPYPLLQNWIQPILSLQPADGDNAATISGPAAAPASLPGMSLARQQATAATAYGENGEIYLISGSVDDSANTLNGTSAFPIVQVSRYDPSRQSVLWTAGVPGTVLANSNANAGTDDNPIYGELSPSGATVHDGYLYFLLSSQTAYEAGPKEESISINPGRMDLFSIKLSDLRSGGSMATAKWVSSLNGQTTSLQPALVSEGDRLGVYYVSQDNSKNSSYNYNILYTSSTDPQASEVWNFPNNGLINWEADSSSSAIQLSNPGQTQNIAATRFRGTTYLAFSGKFDDDHDVYVVEQPDNYDPDSDSPTAWRRSREIQNTEPGQIFLGANASQLALVTTNLTGDNNPFGLHLFSSIEASPASATLQAGAAAAVVGASSIGGRLHVQTQPTGDKGAYSGAIGLQPVATPWASASQKSLAGYSIDGNVDVNGDGFMDMLVSDPSDPKQSVNNQYALFGGDYLNIASQVGTTGNDVMVGTPLADMIYSIEGADLIESNGGADVILTGAGDDAISIANNAFIRIDAGSGFDQLQLQGLANQSYDFRLNVPDPEYFAGTKLRDIEWIDSSDHGANRLSFDAAAVNAINPDRLLFLTPDAEDSIALSSDFRRNTAFDTRYSGSLWSAYTAASDPSDTNPALIYVATPSGQTADWLNTHVSLGATAETASRQAEALTAGAGLGAPAGTATTAGSGRALLPRPSALISRTEFGQGLVLEALRTTPTAGVARFRLQRTEASGSQLIAYSSSSLNSNSEAGRHHDAIVGLLRLEAGELSREISVPITPEALSELRAPTFSLKVEELRDRGQPELHLLLSPETNADGERPVLSELALTVDQQASQATLQLRADTTSDYAQARQELRLTLTRRSSADADPGEEGARSQTLELRDGRQTAFDLDHRRNDQVALQLTLNLEQDGRALRLNAADGTSADNSHKDRPLNLLHEPRFLPAPDATLQVGDPELQVTDSDNASPTRFLLQGSLHRRAAETVEIGYIQLHAEESATALLQDPELFRSRARTLLTSLPKQPGTLLPEEFEASRDFFIKNQRRLLLYAVEGAGLAELDSLDDRRFSLLEARPSDDSEQRARFRTPGGARLQLQVIDDLQQLDTRLATQQGRAPVLDLSHYSEKHTLRGSLDLIHNSDAPARADSPTAAMESTAAGTESADSTDATAANPVNGANGANDAEHDVIIRFYRCLDPQGTVLDQNGEPLVPGQRGYAKAALLPENRIDTLQAAAPEAPGSRSKDFAIAGGSFAAPTALVKSDGDRSRFFAFPAANPEGLSAFAVLAANTFGFDNPLHSGAPAYSDVIARIQPTEVI